MRSYKDHIETYPMLIELRIRPGQFKISSTINKVAHEFHFSTTKVHNVPHLTLYGSFQTNHVDKVIHVVEHLGKNYDGLSYVIDGFKQLDADKGKVIYFNIVPSKDLTTFRHDLSNNLRKFAPSTKSFDYEKQFTFHITLCFKLSEDEAERVMSFLAEPPKDHPEYRPLGQFYFPFDASRLTFLGNDSKIICEYDMMQKKILFRREALSKNAWKKTFEIYRNKNDFEVNDDRHSLKPQTYLISDLHLDHENIIRYCARPFSDIDEMNRILVGNWNRIVSPNDTVYFLGDMSYGRDSHSSSFWLKKLNGKIIFIRGNHDRGVGETSDHQILEHDTYRFLLVHDPNKLPIKWDDWIIHGDKHNNNLSSHPFINRKKKTVNVSCEVIGYKPINLEEIIRQINKDSGDQVLVK